jgi:hypothetical protein
MPGQAPVHSSNVVRTAGRALLTFPPLLPTQSFHNLMYISINLTYISIHVRTIHLLASALVKLCRQGLARLGAVARSMPGC